MSKRRGSSAKHVHRLESPESVSTVNMSFTSPFDDSQSSFTDHVLPFPSS